MDGSSPYELPALPIDYIHKCNRPILSICLCGLEDRRARSASLISNLVQQAEANEGVEVLICYDRGTVPSGWKRHLLSVTSAGDYITFVDDDDQVTPDYVENILRGCKRGVDVVTFNLLRVEGNFRRDVQRFRLAEKDHVRTPDHIRMTANHLCAWKRQLQRLVAFPPFLGYNDDCLWYKPLVNTGWAKSEFCINKVLYVYHFSRQDSVNQREGQKVKAKRIVQEGLECFMQVATREVFIATRPVNLVGTDLIISCRDCDNSVVKKSRAEMLHYYTVRIK